MRNGDDESAKAIGRSMRRYRELCGMSEADAAKALGVSRRTLRNYETGATCIRTDKAVLAAELYGITMRKLLELDGGSAPKTVPEKQKK